MIDFSRLLSPAALARLEWTRRELERLHGLPDRWLAEEILRLARRARAELPDRLGVRGYTYDTALVWDVVPEIARRLGSTALNRDEALRPEARWCADEDLRVYAGQCVRFTVMGWWMEREGRGLSAAGLLAHEVVNGNPVAMAVDRLCKAPPKGADKDDYIARSVREISRLRGFSETAVWHPGLQVKRDRDMDR